MMSKLRHRAGCFDRQRRRRYRCSDRSGDDLAAGPLTGNQHDAGPDFVADFGTRPDQARGGNPRIIVSVQNIRHLDSVAAVVYVPERNMN